MDALQQRERPGGRLLVHCRDPGPQLFDFRDLGRGDRQPAEHAVQGDGHILLGGGGGRQRLRHEPVQLGRPRPQLEGAVGEVLAALRGTDGQLPTVLRAGHEVLHQRQLAGGRAAVRGRPLAGQPTEQRRRAPRAGGRQRGERRDIRVLAVLHHAEDLDEHATPVLQLADDGRVGLLTREPPAGTHRHVLAEAMPLGVRLPTLGTFRSGHQLHQRRDVRLLRRTVVEVPATGLADESRLVPIALHPGNHRHLVDARRPRRVIAEEVGDDADVRVRRFGVE